MTHSQNHPKRQNQDGSYDNEPMVLAQDRNTTDRPSQLEDDRIERAQRDATRDPNRTIPEDDSFQRANSPGNPDNGPNTATPRRRTRP